jgi:hypothetical protein
MSDEFLVITSDLRQDSETWASWSERMALMEAGVPQGGKGLNALDFSILDGAQVVAMAYFMSATKLAMGLKAGTEVFKGISRKLDTIADVYDAAESDVVGVLSRING